MTGQINGRCEVGKYYLVPCLRASSTPPNFARKGEWIPVLLPKHDDAEIIGLSARHWHLDFRFLADRQYMEAGMGSILYDQITEASESLPKLPFYEGQILYRSMKWMREMPFCYPRHLARWYPKLEAAYANARLSKFRCPHKGIDLC
jgi:hypothetical protein